MTQTKSVRFEVGISSSMVKTNAGVLAKPQEMQRYIQIVLLKLKNGYNNYKLPC